MKQLARFLHVSCYLIPLFVLSPLKAQVVSAEVPYYTYGEGRGISPDDSLYLLNIRFRMQSRFSYITKSASDRALDESYLGLRRLRLGMDGFFYKPEIVYIIQLGLAESEIRSRLSTVPSLIKDAIIFYRFNKRTILGWGKTSLPLNRQSIISSGDLEFIERSLLHSTFAPFREFGLHFYYYKDINGFYVAFRSSLTAGNESEDFTSVRGISVSQRIELLPFGKFKKNGDYFEGDLEREESPKLSFGAAYGLGIKERRTGNTSAVFLYAPRNISYLVLDGIFKYQGFSVLSEFICRKSNRDPVTRNASGELSYILTGSGINFQSGYIFRNSFGVAIRYTSILPGREVYSETGNVHEYTIGLTKYIKGHRLKVQSDFSYIDQNETQLAPFKTMSQFRFRIQVELGL